MRNWELDGSTIPGDTLLFTPYNINNTLKCTRTIDSFSVFNESAKLDYPVGLLTEYERSLMGNIYARSGQWWWLASPYFMSSLDASVRDVYTSGGAYLNNVAFAGGARPVVSLNSGTKFVSGNGSYDTPFVVQES